MTPEEAKLVDKFMGEDYSCSFDEYTNYDNWNNLMQVVEKIEREYTTRIINYSDEYTNICEIETTEEDPLQIVYSYAHIMEKSKLEVVQYAVIEFVKWYNTQKHD